MVSETSLLIQSKLATSVCNLESDSRDEFSTTKRTLGWTEAWGASEQEIDIEGKDEECWKLEQDTILDGLSSNTSASQRFPDIPLIILQYRPAWLEQLVLRIAGIPHLVVNTAYASHESTGTLPALRDLLTTSSGLSSGEEITNTPETIPILVGRRQPSLRLGKTDGGELPEATTANGNRSFASTLTPENSILEYLKQHKGVDLDASLRSTNETTTSKQYALAKLLSLLITIKLQTCLNVQRYEDGDVWEQVYRKQCLQSSKTQSSDASNATSNNNNKSKSLSSYLPTMRGLYQAWSERVMARKALLQLQSGNKQVSVDEAKAEAIKAYEILEQQLSQIESGRYLADTVEPTMVDALLWSHLAEALCDVNLVLVLVDFPVLVQYFQRIYDTYFAASSASVSQNDKSWSVWNKYQNHVNPFQQIPLEANKIKEQNGGKKIKHALKLMQTLSVRDHDLLEVLKVGKETRSQELTSKSDTTKQQSKASNPGGAAGVDESKSKTESALEKARQLQQRHDQYWITLVAGVAVLGGLSTVARMVTDVA